MPEINSSKFELKFFKRKSVSEKKVAKSPETVQKTPKSPVSRVKIAPPYAYVEELVVSSPSERNWRGIFIALLVIAAVLGLIVFSIVLVSPPEECPRTKGTKPNLEDIFLKLPPPATFNGTWISVIIRNIYNALVEPLRVIKRREREGKLMMDINSIKSLNAEMQQDLREIRNGQATYRKERDKIREKNEILNDENNATKMKMREIIFG
ncbi:hypothetical protein GWI33_001473 [Rhynchophorus ferrugineus]|uniref:Uncharacterized protein n=1 Tax=Rhynchophorus ferrugineus TaxID=354439 RepID=A0A834MLR5_RHYFE|nr:hypothetical protein GWI33_001473 [Rhynchophorus ferrugineus]